MFYADSHSGRHHRIERAVGECRRGEIGGHIKHASHVEQEPIKILISLIVNLLQGSLVVLGLRHHHRCHVEGEDYGK